MSEAVELLQILIQNACVNDGSVESGFEHRSVATLQGFFGAEGRVHEPAPGRQSLVYRIAGNDPDQPTLAMVPHIDVVPVDVAGWTVDPFAAEIVDGFVYGRGAVDMLNVTSAMAMAVRPYVTGEKQPAGDLVFAAVADEETGGRYGAQPLVEHHWEEVGADYLLTEVAYPSLGSAVPVSVGEKGAFWSVLRSTGTPSHGSAPYGSDNALEKLVRALHGIFTSDTPVLIDSSWEEFVGHLGLDGTTTEALKNPDRVDAAIDQIAVSDPLLARYIHAATHMTVSPNRALSGSKTNTVADRARSDVDIRALPGTTRRDIDVYLRKAMGSASDDVEIDPVMDMEATISERSSRLWEAIADAVEELEGHRHLVPTMMTVATDARFWRRRGTVAYGVGLFDDRMSFAEMLGLFHGNDERVSTESVNRTASLYEKVLDHFWDAGK